MWKNTGQSGRDHNDEPNDEEGEGHLICTMKGKDWEAMPYPIIVDSGAAENVMPKGWAPQATLQKGSNVGKTYSAANGPSIKNEGSKQDQSN